MTTTPLLHSGNKNLKEIPQIVTSTKATNMAKQAIGQIKDLALIAKKRTNSYQQPQINKNIQKCFNCGKKRYYAWDCYLTIFIKSQKTKKLLKRLNKLNQKRIKQLKRLPSSDQLIKTKTISILTHTLQVRLL